MNTRSPDNLYRLGIDVGGTFTDVCLLDVASHVTWVHKVPTVPADQSQGIAVGIEEIASLAKAEPNGITFLGHGTTVATNAVLEGKLASTGIITTQGFRDLLEIRRQKRPHLYDLFVEKPPPLIPRHLRLEVPERISHTGEVLLPLEEDAVRQAGETLIDAGVSAIAICFLFAYINPDHERLAKDIVQSLAPDLIVCTSHEVLPEFREFERFSTTVINAALIPVMRTYVTNFSDRSHNLGIASAPYIMQSSGGVASVETAAEGPVQTILSGPSAGVIGALFVAQQLGIDNIINLDMGGTSTDVSLVEGGTLRVTSEGEIGGNPIKVPMIEIHTIGAGGGSIAKVDAGKHLLVGPESAGARPGPASYGLGGEQPTVTDANIVVARLNQERILGGRMAVHAAKARDAIVQHVATPLDLSLEDAARGIISVVNTNMALAARLVSVEKGYDPRDFSLVAFGGAGPLHAAAIARDLGIRQIIIPPRPGILCAIGLLVTDLQRNFSQSILCLAVPDQLDAINKLWAELEARATRWWEQEGIEPSRRMMERTADSRYLGQHFELRVAAGQGAWNERDMDEVAQAFHLHHERRYGYKADEEPIQLVNLRVTAYGLIEKPTRLLEATSNSRQGHTSIIGKRRVDWGIDHGFLETQVYARDRLGYTDRLHGPAIIEQLDSTTLIPPDYSATVASNGSLVLTPN